MHTAPIRSIAPASAALALSGPALAQPYDFSSATALLNSQLPNLSNHVAVIVRQDGRDIYRYQAGDINYSTITHLASFTKTLSAATILALRDEGRLTLTETLGATFVLFNNSGIGTPTVTDCFGMRHGITTTIAYERDPRYTLAQSVTLIGLTGSSLFTPGTKLDYDGSGMQAVGRIAELRTGQAWETIARTRVFNPCNMPLADYQEFAPNPAIAGGARSSADETIRFAEMIINNGQYNGATVLSPASISQLFTNATRNLPTLNIPFPPTHPNYPYGQQPDYGFGDWILAEYPADLFVEEFVGAGAWGSFIWVDRRRGLTAVLITDVPAGSQNSLDSALGLFAIARAQIDAQQVTNLSVQLNPTSSPLTAQLQWTGVPTATGYRIYTSNTPIRSVYNLRAAALLTQTSAAQATLPAAPYYAVTAIFNAHENPALTPNSNTLLTELPCARTCSLADVADDASQTTRCGNGSVGPEDLEAFVNAFIVNNAAVADVASDSSDTTYTPNGSIGPEDLEAFINSFIAGC